MIDLIDTLLELLAQSLFWTLMAAMAAAPLALLVLLFDRLVGRWMTARVRGWLWLLVALRLLMPFAPGSPVSAQHMWGLLERDSQNQPAVELRAVDGVLELDLPAHLSEWEAGWSDDTPPAAQPSAVAPTGWDWESVIAVVLILAWPIGVATVLLRAVVASARFGWRLRSIPFVEDQATIDIVLRVCDQLGVSRRPQVKYVPGLPAPALFGAFRPVLCLPEETQATLACAQLRMIVLHEAMHLRRRDGLTAWLLTLVRAVHWFNPIAWFTVRQIEAYREQACDDAVRRFTDIQERSVYADLLLRFASGQPAASLGLLGLWFARPAKNLTARIESFTADEGRRRLPWLASGALIVLLAVIGLTDAAGSASQERAAATTSTLKLPPTFAWDLLDASADDAGKQASEEVEEREYDLTEAIDNYTDVPAGQNARQWLLLHAKGFGSMPPGKSTASIRADIESPNRVTISMTRRGHDFFANYLDEVCRLGTAWQVCVATRVFRAEHVEEVQGIDWRDAVRFTAPAPVSNAKWATDAADDAPAGDAVSVSMESVSFQYTPYLVMTLDKDKMAQVVEQIPSRAQSAYHSAPKVTLFSGQAASVVDESHSPFVVGVDYVRGELATVAQPKIAVLSEGARLDVQPRVIDPETLDLRCRLTLSFIDGVIEARLPGQNVTVQAPRATSRTVTARCRVKRGETLLIAPLTGWSGKNQQDGFFYYAISTDWFPDPIVDAE